jgi:hypothetical protein
MSHVIFLLSATNRLHNLNAIASLYGDDRMRTAGDNFHIHSHGGTFPIGNAERFKEATHRTACRDRLFLAVNVNIDHKHNPRHKKNRNARRAATFLPRRCFTSPSRLRLYQYE